MQDTNIYNGSDRGFSANDTATATKTYHKNRNQVNDPMPVFGGECTLHHPFNTGTDQFYRAMNEKYTYINIPSPRRSAPKDEVISSTETLHCFESNT